MRLHIVVRDKGRTVRASYPGGAYIDLFFGHMREAIEVINVWNYETDLPEDPRLRSEDPDEITDAIEAQVRAWIISSDEEWPEWYEGYQKNASF